MSEQFSKAFVLIGVLVFALVSLGGCGAFTVSGGSSISGTVVDNATKLPVAGALVWLEQPDANGSARVILSAVSASNGSFGFDPPSPGTFNVVADASVPSASGTTATYAPTITFGVPASANLNQIPL